MVVTLVAIFSQYFLPQTVPPLRPVYASLVGGVAIVYGIPILTFALLVGRRPIARWAAEPKTAVWEGLRWYALFSLLSLVVVGILLAILEHYDAQILELLSKPNPVLEGAASDPYFWVGFSFAVGAFEETIFRGYIFGYWLERDPDNWVGHAIWTSALFAGVHLYYGTTYLIAAPVIYAELFLLGFAFAGIVRTSGGNLWMVAFLHGAHDAAAFLTLVNEPLALGVAYGLIGIGALVALIDLAMTSAPGATPPETRPPFGPEGGFPPPPPPGSWPPVSGPWIPPPAPPIEPPGGPPYQGRSAGGVGRSTGSVPGSASAPRWGQVPRRTGTS